jgi:hypothetical protein
MIDFSIQIITRIMKCKLCLNLHGIYFSKTSALHLELAFDKINLFKNKEQFNNFSIINDKLIYIRLEIKGINVWKAKK